MAWIAELAPGQRRLRHGPVPAELKREAVVAVASGRLKSHEAAAELGVRGATVREWKRQMLAGSKETPVTETPGRKPPTAGKGKSGVRPMTPEAMPASASGPREAADPTDVLASMEARLAALAGPSGQTGRRRRTAAAGEEGAGHRDRDPEGHVGAVGKRAGRRPGKARPAARRRSSSRPLARRWALPPGASCPWSASRAARTTTSSTP